MEGLNTINPDGKPFIHKGTPDLLEFELNGVKYSETVVFYAREGDNGRYLDLGTDVCFFFGVAPCP